MTGPEFVDALRWRYATKQFDPEKTVSDEDLALISEAFRLAPSSVNLQPYRLLTLTDRAKIETLTEATWLPNRPKLTGCSALLVLTVPTDLRAETVERFLDRLALDRGIDRATLSEVEAKAKAFLLGMTPEDRIAWARRQAFLALGVLLSACAAARVDSCPMEGFIASGYDRALGLPEQNQTTAALVALGYRSDADTSAEVPKYRRPADTIIASA